MNSNNLLMKTGNQAASKVQLITHLSWGHIATWLYK